MNTTIIAACAVCLAAAMLLDNRLDIPLGLTCPLVSFLICYFAYDMTAGKVITAFFPSTIVFPLILAMAFFSTFTANGSSEVIARSILNLIRGKMRLYPWLLYLLCSCMYIFFDGGALRYIITPLVFSVAKAGGGSVLMAVSTAYLSFAVGSLNPYVGIDASTRTGILTDIGLENAANINLAVWLNAILLFTLLQAFVYFITGSWKIPDTVYNGNGKTEQLTASQKKSFILLGITVLVFVLPPLLASFVPCSLTRSLSVVLNSYMVFICGMLAAIVLRLGDWRSMLKHVSLRPIMMIVGITFLIKTAQKAGLQELCLSAASAVPDWLVPSVLLLIAAALSFFVAAPTVQPMLFTMACAMASTPVQAIIYISCVTVGTVASGVSPISNSGVAFLSTIDPNEHEIYTKHMFRLAIWGPVFMALLCSTGILRIVASFFSSLYY